MPQQGYSIGRDRSIVIILNDGTSLRLGKVTDFDSKPKTSNQTIKPLDGIIDNLRFHEGWSFSLKTERRSPDLDNYWAGIEANYYAGISEPPVTMIETTQEPDGSVSQFRYERVVLSFDEAGAWAADKSVSQSMSGHASKRIKQA